MGRVGALDLLIVGGGIHGTTLSHILTATGAVAKNRLAVIDPHRRPLALWNRMTAQCGMRFLRSPGAHSIDGDFLSLRRYAATHGHHKGQSTVPPNGRPSLELFSRHAYWVIREYNLDQYRLSGRATDVRRHGAGWIVDTDKGSIEAGRICFCVGRTEQLSVPEISADAPISHVYDERFSREIAAAAENPVVLGGGIAAAQVAVAIAEDRTARKPVRMLSPLPLEVAQYDSDPCYIGPRCAPEFLALTNVTQRRKLIDRVRYPGTMPDDVYSALMASVRRKKVLLTVDSRFLERKPLVTDTDYIVAATGFRPGPPLKPILEKLQKRHDLQLDATGYPVVDKALQWTEGLHMASALGELEIGPAAGNIIGAHLAARRLVPFFKELEITRPFQPLTRWWPKTDS